MTATPVETIVTLRCAAELTCAIEHLQRLRIDAKNYRASEDPQQHDSGWDRFLEGIDACIYRLQMHYQ